MSEEKPRCGNPTCPEKDKQKYPSGRNVDPDEELVLVELLIQLPGRVPAVASTAWLCYTPCLGPFDANQVQRCMSKFEPGQSLVHWRYYADHRYILAKDFAKTLPELFEKMLHSEPKPLSSPFFRLFWRRH